MKQIALTDKIGALCSDDFKGINNQYVEQGKVVIVESICGTQLRWMDRSAESRATTAFRWNLWGGTENIVSETKSVDERNFTEGNGTLHSVTQSNNVQSNNVVRQQYAVRRLTPLEAERLQGLPDNFTLIDDKTCSDSARYKALGNGMAQPCADYVLSRLVDCVNKNNETDL